MELGSPAEPLYAKIPHEHSEGTQLWFITCDEGWRSSIVCDGLHEWTADWLLEVLGHRPFAPNHRPGGYT